MNDGRLLRWVSQDEQTTLNVVSKQKLLFNSLSVNAEKVNTFKRLHQDRQVKKKA